MATPAPVAGLATWARVRDHRVGRIERGGRVEVYPASRLEAGDVLALGIPRVVVATGARWRRDGVGRRHRLPVAMDPALPVLTPDDLLDGTEPPAGPVVVFDDDHYYLGGVLAERLHRRERPVTLITPAPVVSQWTLYTLEQARIQRRLLELGVTIVPLHGLAALEADGAVLECVYTARERRVPAASVVLVTAREPEDGLHRALVADPHALAEAGIETVERIGDCLAPGTIAAAVWSGHRLARELDEAPATLAMRREVVPVRVDD